MVSKKTALIVSLSSAVIIGIFTAGVFMYYPEINPGFSAGLAVFVLGFFGMIAKS